MTDKVPGDKRRNSDGREQEAKVLSSEVLKVPAVTPGFIPFAPDKGCPELIGGHRAERYPKGVVPRVPMSKIARDRYPASIEVSRTLGSRRVEAGEDKSWTGDCAGGVLW